LLAVGFILILHAALRGFTEEFFAVAWLVLGLLAAFRFFHEGAAFIRTKILSTTPYLPEILAFAAIFAVVFMAVQFVSRLLEDIVKRTRLAGLDHALGALFGVCEAIALAFVVLYLLRIQPIHEAKNLVDHSLLAKMLLPHAAQVKAVIGTIPVK
jgi:membrane protein required for colicin V production